MPAIAAIAGGSGQERADVLADPLADSDCEARFGGNLECGIRDVGDLRIGSIESDIAGSVGDFHPLSGIGPKMVGAGKNQPERLAGFVSEPDRVGYDAPIEVDIRFGNGGNIWKFHDGH